MNDYDEVIAQLRSIFGLSDTVQQGQHARQVARCEQYESVGCTVLTKTEPELERGRGSSLLRRLPSLRHDGSSRAIMPHRYVI